MSEPRIDGRTAIVTGGARGLGRAMALGLLRAGANVSLVDIDGDQLEKTAAEAAALGGADRVLSVVTDVSDDDAVEPAELLDGRPHGAGIGPPAGERSLFNNPEKFWETDAAVWRKTIEVNAIGSYLMSWTAASHMIDGGWGRIINVTTSLNSMYMPGCGAYGPSKAALEASVRYLAVDLGGRGVRVNALSAGPMRTIAGAAIGDARRILNWYRESSALGRNVRLEEVGGAGLYLLSDLSAGVTGEVHHVDCGSHAVAMPRATGLDATTDADR